MRYVFGFSEREVTRLHLIERKALRFGCSDGHEWRRNQPWETSSAVVTKILKSLQPADPDTVEIQTPSAKTYFGRSALRTNGAAFTQSTWYYKAVITSM